MTNERETERNKRARESPIVSWDGEGRTAVFVLAGMDSFSRVSFVGISRLRRKRDYFCRGSTWPQGRVVPSSARCSVPGKCSQRRTYVRSRSKFL